MKTIWKYPLKFEKEHQLELPAGAKALHAGLDIFAVPCVWCIVDDKTKDQVATDFFVLATGEMIPPKATRYLGTFLWKINNTVWHVFTHDKI